MAQPSSLKLEIAADLDRARAKIARSYGALREDLDFPRHLKSSFTRHKVPFIGVAAVLGLILGKLPARKKKIYIDRASNKRVKDVEKAGFGLMLLDLAMKAARPALVSLATRKIGEFARSRDDGRL